MSDPSTIEANDAEMKRFEVHSRYGFRRDALPERSAP